MKYLEYFERKIYSVKSSVYLISLIKRICRKLNLVYIDYISSGSFGDAFEVDDRGIRKVLKITTDREEAKTSKLLRGKDLPGIIKVYDVFRVRSENLKRFENYVIIMDKVNPLNKRTLSSLDRAIDKITDDESFIIPNAVDDLPESKIKTELKKIIDSLKSIGLKEDKVDIHSGNIGMNKDGLVLFDLSVVDFDFIKDSIIDI